MTRPSRSARTGPRPTAAALTYALRRGVAGCVVLLLCSAAARATPSSEAPASLLVFPLISVDATANVDTVVQLSNLGDDPQPVRCVYVDGSLAPNSSAAFQFTLTAAQPLQWRASQGLAALPIAGMNSGAVATVPVVPFSGTLRCVATTADGTPAPSDALIGVATIESGSPAIDSASYAAVGFAATGSSADAPEVLVLGGAQAEYAACPAEVALQPLLDGALIELGTAPGVQRETATTLAIATCSSAPSGGGAQATVTLLLTTELGQEFSLARGVRELLVSDLSRLDTNVPRQSIFNSANAGAPNGSLRITANSPGSAVLAVALTAYVDPAHTATAHRVALQTQMNGDRDLPDLVDLGLPAPPSCPGDCNGDSEVAINELIVGVNIALGTSPLSTCPAFDSSGDGSVTINELIAAVNAALTGC
ncbi:MAG: hypothetical protein ABI629_11155 [bacterium]